MKETSVAPPEIVTRIKDKLAELGTPSHDDIENYKQYLGETSQGLEFDDLVYLAVLEAVVRQHEMACARFSLTLECMPGNLKALRICISPPPPHRC